MTDRPGEPVTFLFTDIEGSTALWEQAPEQMRRALRVHDQLIEEIVNQLGGQVVRPRGEGDSRFAVFTSAAEAVCAGGAIQQALFKQDWETPRPIRARMALHTGEAEWVAGDYYGSDVNRCARIRGMAHGGQTILSARTALLAQDRLPDALKLRDLGQHYLRDLNQPEHIFQLDVEGMPSDFPSLKKMESNDERNRRRLLDNVRHFWIEGVLNRSLLHTILLDLATLPQPEAVIPILPWDISLRQRAQQGSTPCQEPIIDLYDRFNGQFLLLGAPGAGKTTMLLALTNALLNRAEWDASHPIPVVFTLSAWASQHLRLDRWMVDEMHRRYRVPPQVGRSWIQNSQIIPLLDGLDEVALHERSACITAINEYQDLYAPEALVICSRSADYELLEERLKLNDAVELQPLAWTQVETYFRQLGPEYVAIFTRIQEDGILRELITSPLMLSILTAACHYLPQLADKHWQQLDAEQYRGILFDTYVQQMLDRPEAYRIYGHTFPGGETTVLKPIVQSESTAGHEYHPQQVRSWLAWLARWLAQRNETLFYIEQLQIDALPATAQAWYFRLLALLLAAIVGVTAGIGSQHIGTGVLWATATGVAILIAGDIYKHNFATINRQRYAQWALLLGLAWGGSETIAYWLAQGDIVALQPKMLNDLHISSYVALALQQQLIARPFIIPGLLLGLLTGIFSTVASLCLLFGFARLRRFLQRYGNPVAMGIAVGLFVGLSAGIGTGLGLEFAQIFLQVESGIGNYWEHALLRGIEVALSTTLCASVLAGIISEIRPVERLRWSWQSAFYLSSLVAIGYALIGKTPSAIFLSLVVGSLSGMSSLAEVELRRFPNQGIWQSASNALWGAAIGVLIGLCTWFFQRLLPTSQEIGILAGVIIGVLWSLRGGMLVCLQHIVLRFLLLQQGVIARNYAHFLDYGVERLLLRRVGGGYIFVHRTLLDYFANQPITPLNQELPPSHPDQATRPLAQLFPLRSESVTTERI